MSKLDDLGGLENAKSMRDNYARRNEGPAAEFLDALIERVEELERENIRFHDLVRHQRVALHVQGLITDDEYAELAADTRAVARLETYDRLHNRVDEFELELEKAEHSAPSEVVDAILYCVNTLPDGRAKELCKNALNWKSDSARIRLYKKELKPLRELAEMVEVLAFEATPMRDNRMSMTVSTSSVLKARKKIEEAKAREWKKLVPK